MVCVDGCLWLRVLVVCACLCVCSSPRDWAAAFHDGLNQIEMRHPKKSHQLGVT